MNQDINMTRASCFDGMTRASFFDGKNEFNFIYL